MAQKITPNLWFDGNAEEAANFYVDVFDDGRITKVAHYPEGSGSAGCCGGVAGLASNPWNPLKSATVRGGGSGSGAGTAIGVDPTSVSGGGARW